jgi:APA family basic amino acid/polyamine antiporter
MILRARRPATPRPVRTPLYPLFPALFLAVSIYMFAAGLADLGVGALYGFAVMAAGAVVLFALLLTPRLAPAKAR